MAAELGMSSEWVRRQLRAGTLRGRAYVTGSRRTYCIRRSDLQRFLRTYSRDARESREGEQGDG